MIRKITRSAVLISAAFAAIGCASAKAQSGYTVSGDKPNRGWSGKSSRSDLPADAQMDNSARNFVMDVAQDGMTEVKLGHIAERQGASSKVREFGRMMVADHAKANRQLMRLTSNKGITLPTELDEEHQAMVDRLSRLHGAAFDSAYARMMVADHKKAVAAFQARANSGRNTDLRMWAASTLPTLREHLKMARDLNSRNAAYR
jgi:putative membrane protein